MRGTASIDNAFPSAATIWDEPDTSDDEGVSIEGDGIQIDGDVVGGSVVKVMPPQPAVKAESVAVAVPGVVEPAPKLSWWEKIKRWFSS